MKNYKLLLGSAFLSGMLLFSASMYLKNNIQNNFRTNNETDDIEDERGAVGAANWLFNIQKNQLTGKVNELDVLRTREEIAQMNQFKSVSAALGLEWNELGPDNVGGRTRAILIDKYNSSKIFAGSVGGGLWVSTDAGASWSNVTGFDQQPILNISCITQAANGDIYCGTGEDLYNGFGTGAAAGTGPGGMLGGGIYKSSDNGATFVLLPSTIPATANSTGNSATNKFLGVNNMAADPTNANRIYAATRYGLQMTDDGGVTWVHPILYINGTPNTSRTTDVDVASDGTVIVALSGRGYMSATGNSGTFTIIPTTAGLATSGIGRAEFAFAPSDPNYIYAVIGSSSGLLKGVYQSIDKGVSWTLIGNGGSAQFEPFGSSSQAGQADYDMALAVAPSNKTSIIIGGVSLWGWCATNQSSPSVGQWKEVSTLSEYYYASTIPRPDYVHADVHTIKFSTTSPNTMYIGCDGGVFRSTNIYPTFIPTPHYIRSNHNYNVSQLYSIAFESDNINGTGVMGGLQDNGTQYISGTGNTSKTAKHIDGGDGAECEISFLNPGVSFSTVYYGALARHATKGSEGSDFYSWNISSQLSANTLGASFVTPIALYETKTATNSPDSVMFINGAVSQILGSGNGSNKHFTGYLVLPQQSASFVPDSVVITSGLKKVNDNGAGLLIGNVDLTQTNTFNYATGYYDFYFSAAPALGAPVNASFYVKYASGSTIGITRSDYASPLNFTTAIAIDPSDTVMVYDPFQAKLAVGFTSHVYMTKGCLDFSGIPAWLHIGTIVGTSEELAWSADGDILYVGTDGGNLYRFSNLAAVKDSVTGDIASPSCVVVKTQIAGFGGRCITGLSVDATDANKVAISLGNYGNSAYIYYSSNAATAASSSAISPNFATRQGISTTKLPAMPVYSVLIEKNDPKRVIVGTEYGIYSTSDISVANPVWSTDNGINQKFPNTPVFKIRQQRRDGSEVTNPYVIYAGTHGRGAWKSETFKGLVYIGINEHSSPNAAKQESGISIYPNPMTENGTVSFNLASTSSVIVSIYNLQGKLVKSIKSGLLIAGDQKIEINTAELSKGTYLLSIDGSAVHATSKFVVVK